MQQHRYFAAQTVWENATQPVPKVREIRPGLEFEEQFRKYGSAVAWLEWEEGHCTIMKIESLMQRSGAARELMHFLIGLADEYGIVLRGNPVPYPPSFEEATKSPLSQEDLLRWYRGLGFEVWENRSARFMRYPPRQSTETTDVR